LVNQITAYQILRSYHHNSVIMDLIGEISLLIR